MSSGPPSFASLRRAADQIKGSQLPSLSTATTSLSKHIPASFTWADLARELVPLEDEDNAGRVLALKACLEADPSRLEASEEEEEEEEKEKEKEARRQIRQFVAGVLSPIVAREDDDDDDLTHGTDLAGRREQAVRRCRAYSSSGIAVLERVGLPVIKSPQGKVHEAVAIEGDDAEVLYTLTALADEGQPWTTDAAAQSAARLLATAFTTPAHAAKSLWIVDGILKQYLRPLFARSRPATVTESGRKAEFASSGGGAAMTDIARAESPKNKPWKYVDLRAISVFAWAVQEADGRLIRENWPLFIPVLLALIDDPDTTVRARGLVLLKTFIEAVPRLGGADGDGSLLHATGLDSVLADAIFPTLLFLPRLTPEKESLQLLGPAYQALLSLASTATATATAAGKDKHKHRNTLLSKPAADLLDRVLRDGIYTGYFHANEHIRIVEELVRQAGYIVQAMGIYAVKHLKDLMPLYAGIMSDPFAMSYLPAVAATVDALQTTVATCWPRLANTPWQEETLKMLMLCWLNADEDTSGGADAQTHRAQLQAQLVKTADTQLAVMRAAKVDLDAAVGPLIAKEPRLKALFKL